MLTIARLAPVTATLATLLAALPAAPRAAHAQSLRGPEVGFGAGVASLVLLNRVYPYRPGSLGQHDAMLARDKALHFGAAAIGTAAGAAFGARPGFAAATVCASGVAFEYTQRRVSARDMVATCSGAALTWGVHRVVARVSGTARGRRPRASRGARDRRRGAGRMPPGPSPARLRRVMLECPRRPARSV